MIWNYFKYAFRNLVKQRGRTIINLLGLSFGISCVIVIYLYSTREISFNNFHENRDRIYRMYTSLNLLTGEKNFSPHQKSDIALAIKERIPGVDKTCRLRSTGAWIGIGEELFQEQVGFTDSTFLEMFSFSVIAGDPVNPLSLLKSVVLTEKVADKLFGDSIINYSEIIGESIMFPEKPPNVYTITAVIANPPETNSFRWGLLVPFENARTYPRCNDFVGNSSVFVMLDEQNDVVKLEETAQTLMRDFHGEGLEQAIHMGFLSETDHDFTYHFQPFTELYLDSEGMRSCYLITGSKRSIYILSCIAVLILLIACFNYVMISIGSSLNRIRDFGLMNVVGARRSHILWHFITESFLLTTLSLFIGIILAEQILPLFNQLAQEDLQFTLYGVWKNFIFLACILILIVLFTSTYIGLHLLRKNQPLRLLRKELLSLRRNGVARISVVLQYLITIILLISSGVILKQLNFMVKQDVGFEKENLIVLPVDFGLKKTITLKDRLLQSSHVLDVTMSDRTFTSGSSSQIIKNEKGEIINVRFLRIDHDYIRTLGLKLLDGRNFFKEEPTKDNYNVIVNESFIKNLEIENPIGEQVTLESNQMTVTIIGIVRDFHFDSMHDEIEALMMHIFPYNSIWAVFVKIDNDIPDALRDMEKAWMEIVPEFTWDFEFMVDNLEMQYKNEDRWSRIIAYSSGIAIFLSCLGLMGISGLLVARRFKEVGIRKANGATIAQVIFLLNIDILKWVLVAFVVACPAAYFIMRRWLQDFAYRTEISWWLFILAGLAALLISMMTISLQIYRAARQNPVQALRYE